MSISPIGSNSPITRLQGSKANGITQGTQDAGRGVAGTDTVEISDSARYLSELKNLPDRTDKVQAAKDAIAAGTYETPERINGTVDRLMEALNSF
ncbi:MAG: flagellar biosynthesis anti-sigma factor FlgM [Phycisphaerae bacterium]